MKVSERVARARCVGKVVAGIGLAVLTPIASADALSDLKAQVEALQRKVIDLEAAQHAEAEASRKTAEATAKEVKAVTADVVTAGATKGSFKLPGSDTSVTIGGYVKLDAIYSDRTAGVASTGNQFLNRASYQSALRRVTTRAARPRSTHASPVCSSRPRRRPPSAT